MDRNTGGLFAQSVRLAILRSTPRVVSKLSGGSKLLFQVETQPGGHSIFLWSRHRLDLLVEPSIDCLYLFGYATSTTSTAFCLLRPDPTYGACNSQLLVADCDMVIFSFPISLAFPGSGAAREMTYGFDTRMNNTTGNSLDPYAQQLSFKDFKDAIWYWRFQALLESSHPVVGELCWTVHEVIENVRDWLGTTLEPREQLLWFAETKHTEICCLSIRRPSTRNGSWVTSISHPVGLSMPTRHSSNSNDVRVVWCDYSVEIFARTDNIDDLYRRHRFGDIWSQSEYDHGCEIIRYHEELGDLDALPFTFYTQGRFWPPAGRWQGPLKLRMCYQRTIGRILFASRGLKLVYMVREAARLTGETKAQLMSRDPTDADRRVREPTGPLAKTLINHFGCEGTTEEVLIL